MSREYVTQFRCGRLEMSSVRWNPAQDSWGQDAMRNNYFCTVAIRSTTSKYFKLLQHFPLMQRHKTYTGYELELAALYWTMHCLHFSLVRRAQAQKHPTAEEGIRLGSFNSWWCSWTTRLNYLSSSSPHPLLTTNLIQEVSSSSEENFFILGKYLSYNIKIH